MARRILHIAPFNTAGVPMAFVRAERALGFESRLITFGRNPFGFEEDICLDLPWLDSALFRAVRNRISSASRRARRAMQGMAAPEARPPVWQPAHPLESALLALRERIWQPRIEKILKTLDFFSYDIYQLDGGMDFFRDGRYVQELNSRGKRIVCCYLGSDLRTRGVIPAVEAASDLNFTVEFDHLGLHPAIHFLFFPFDPWRFQPRTGENRRLRIFHSATNRLYKGSDEIIAVGRRLEREYGVEFVFTEKAPHAALLAAKQQSDIVIDQITNLGGVGYGISALEALSMGIPVCTRLTPAYEAFLPDHPFVSVTPETLYDRLAGLIRDDERRRGHGRRGREWVEQYHDARRVVRCMQDMYTSLGWFG
jgi:hypothetical protein